MKNQTQFAVECAAKLALHEWVAAGERTYERLMALADHYADNVSSVARLVPKMMVWSETLRLLRERVPDCIPMDRPPQQHSDGR
jgi:hypothetical protein